jgi:hypothetical protein
MRGCRNCKALEAEWHKNWCRTHQPFEDITEAVPPYGKPLLFLVHKRPGHPDPKVPFYSHFCTSEWQLSLYGNHPCAWVTLTPIPNNEALENDYWCWWDAKSGEPKYTGQAEVLVTICFPYDLREKEKWGEGKLTRCRIVEVPGSSEAASGVVPTGGATP